MTTFLTKVINEVWKENDTINNWIGVYWLIQKQLDEFKEAHFTAEACLNEMADILIIGIRYLDKIGINYEKLVLQRLETRHRGRTAEIRTKYEELWEEELKK